MRGHKLDYKDFFANIPSHGLLGLALDAIRMNDLRFGRDCMSELVRRTEKSKPLRENGAPLP